MEPGTARGMRCGGRRRRESIWNGPCAGHTIREPCVVLELEKEGYAASSDRGGTTRCSTKILNSSIPGWAARGASESHFNQSRVSDLDDARDKNITSTCYEATKRELTSFTSTNLTFILRYPDPISLLSSAYESLLLYFFSFSFFFESLSTWISD